MTSPGLIVIGSGPAGVSAAEAFRQRDSRSPVTIITEDAALPYQRPPLSKEFLRGEAEAGDAELHPADWFSENDVQIVRSSRVDAIDVAERIVRVDGTTLPYRSLVLASGAGPVAPSFPGGDTTLLLRSMADAQRLRETAERSTSAVVIGAGFIGCEAAASLAMRGVSATLVAPSAAPQAKRLGERAGARIVDMLNAAGARYTGSVKVEAVESGAVRLDDGTSISADLILAATGVHPRSTLAESAGLAVDDGRVLVDGGMRTSADGVFAAGDVAWAHNAAAGRRIAVEHWQDAVDQGAVAGANAAGAADQWSSVPGFWTTIGEATLKYHAWGDGHDEAHFVEREDGFTVWYERGGAVVGVLTHNADDDYDRGEELVEKGRPLPADVRA
ncbi:FAD-dependent oxidoreductase [Mycobacterium manitobense]|uniref:FAD-dependent oxidoreductase n=1 Tax=[Mycobacterium] manitobense TaxID=190147 RepID=A0A9X2YU67_9MYCO|nr:FAD-dependent oxidoreductase [[Mycobacterium] manitobense]MCV7174118.1 FAD-dependent oxidoreductase [[Mycobacterium] manitobense]